MAPWLQLLSDQISRPSVRGRSQPKPNTNVLVMQTECMVTRIYTHQHIYMLLARKDKCRPQTEVLNNKTPWLLCILVDLRPE
jgi:hypothetical protein